MSPRTYPRRLKIAARRDNIQRYNAAPRHLAATPRHLATTPRDLPQSAETLSRSRLITFAGLLR